MLLGCAGGLEVTRIDAAHEKPSNVAVYFTVEDGDQPVGGLEAEDFRIYEDDKLISEDESKQTIVNQEVAAEHYTLLLVDMSGSVTESDEVQLIEEAARQFTSSVKSHQKVAIYAFDGSEEIHPIRTFRGGGGGAGRVSAFQAQDPSTNLHGAVVKGLEELDDALKKGDAPLRFGTLVVFTDGTDRAARVSYDKMMDTIDESGFDIFSIGVGNEIDEGTLGDIGRNGYVRVEERTALANAFEAIGQRIIDYTKRFYLLSYCSPARAGMHTVTVEAVHQGKTGEASYRFDAKGFGPRCNPEQPPPFDTNRNVRQRIDTPERGTRIELEASASVE
jgi:Mg-chelatase subunit ChlD